MSLVSDAEYQIESLKRQLIHALSVIAPDADHQYVEIAATNINDLIEAHITLMHQQARSR